MFKDTDTFDTWFSSGQWPFAALGYPDSDDFRTFFPTDVMETAGEIIFFWVARMIMLSLYVTEDIPFRTVYLHGLVLDEHGEKMSKSRGNFYTAREYLDKYNPELLRFYYASNLAKNSSDLNLDFVDFQGKIDNELVSNISNFIYRTLNFINNNFDSKLSAISKSKEDVVLAATLKSKFSDVLKHYENYNYREAVKTILEISSSGNKYLQDNEPWKLVKSDKDKCQQIMTLAANIVKNLSILLSPIIPDFSLKVQKQIGLENLTFKDLSFNLEKQKINRARILLTNFEEVPTLGKETFPANIKVAQIDSVEEHPGADKLYVLKINLGNEKRQLVAGLREFYKKEDLLERKVLVVTNLKHASIRGQQSEGMLLAADTEGKVELLAAPNETVGKEVFAEGLESSGAEITIDKFYSLGLSVANNHVYYNSKILKTDKVEVTVDAQDGSKIR